MLAYCREVRVPDEAKAIAREVATTLKSSGTGTEDDLLPITMRVAARHVETGHLDDEWRRLLEPVREARAARAFMATLALEPEAAEPEALEPGAAEPAEVAGPAKAAEPVEEPITEPLLLPPDSETGAFSAEPDSEPLEPQEPPRRGLVVFPDDGTQPRRQREEAATPAPVTRFAPRTTAARRGAEPSITPPVAPARTAMPQRSPAPPRVLAGFAALLREYRVFLVTLAVGGVVVAIVALTVGGSSSSATYLPPPSGGVGQAPATTPTVTKHARRRAHRLHSAVRRRPTVTTSASAEVASTTTAAVVTPAPTTQSPTGQSGGVVATQQNGSLPAQTAPTQTVGSGGATPPGH